jgi:1-deoxy-D-xylulose-5-phosphate reductoisomerase
VSRTKKIAILGSTGSIGTNTLEVVRWLKGRVSVVGLTTATSAERLGSQIDEFKPRLAAITGDVGGAALAEVQAACTRCGCHLLRGPEALLNVAAMPEADTIVNALVGVAGAAPTLAAIRAGKSVALANKESLVAAGGIIVEEARRAGVDLMPVDSEHSAIYQCTRGEHASRVRRVILTASGGPLVDADGEALAGATAAEVLSHPTWTMGRKVTVDSATLLNKGFEMIEAHWLFGLPAERIDVVIERRSIVHSLVEFVDGSVAALLSPPDMRLPIQYALTCPERIETPLPRLQLEAMGTLAFERPDRRRFPCLDMAYDALARGGTAPAVLSAADEVAVGAFLDRRIRFGDIHPILSSVLALQRPTDAGSLGAVLDADRWARGETEQIIARRHS